MKKGFFILLGIFLSALIIYGGSGVNAYFYCCDDCRDEGASAVIEHKCCEIHHHHHLGELITHYDDHACHQSFTGEQDECGVKRIQVDWQTSSNNQFQMQPLSVDLDNSIFLPAHEAESAAHHLLLSRWLNRRTQKPPDLSKDDYLLQLTTLII